MNTQAAVAQHLNLAEELILEVQEWVYVLWVRVKGARPRFVGKESMMNNFQKIENYLIKEGIDKVLATKAASFVIGKAWDFESWEYVASRFAARHHKFVKEIFEAEKEKEKETDPQADKADDMVTEIAEIEKYLPMGHLISWNKLHSAAVDILENETTIQEVIERFTSKKVIIKRG